METKRLTDRERARLAVVAPMTARERSGLPGWFRDEDHEAYCWLCDAGIRGWLVDLLKRTCTDYRRAVPVDHLSVAAFAAKCGRTV